MVNFGPIFLFFGSFYAGLTLWNESRLRNFRISNRFLDIASQSWSSGVSKMATYIYIYISCRFIYSRIFRFDVLFNAVHESVKLLQATPLA